MTPAVTSPKLSPILKIRMNWKMRKKLKKKNQIKNFYRPGQLNWKFWLWMEIPQCGNLAIFLGLWFHVKTILADFRRSIIAVLTILEALNFDSWKNFTLDNVKITKNSNLRTAQIVKMAVFGAPKWPKLILHEIWVSEKSRNFHIVNSQLGCPGLYNLKTPFYLKIKSNSIKDWLNSLTLLWSSYTNSTSSRICWYLCVLPCRM